MNVEFSQDEIDTIKKLILDWGFEYSLSANRIKVNALGRKLGMQMPKDD